MTQLNNNPDGLEAFETPKGISRRTVAKAAAWSVPVLALAVATPAASASVQPNWDVTVSKVCTGQYRASGLAAGVITILATVLGLTAATRTFTITATEGTVPAGTVFQLDNAGLVNVGLLTVTGDLTLGALNIVNLGATATITLLSPLTLGQSFTINLLDALIDIKVLGNQTLSLVGNDNPSGVDGADAATITTLAGVTVLAGITNVDLQVCT